MEELLFRHTLTNPGVTLGILINTGFGGFPSLAAVQGH